ncbi:MAG: shikimate dehydrogenase [Methylibium sp. NZG]|nr:MAG: shikimate dehydrogenase [Methylibium sp. NZG]
MNITGSTRVFLILGDPVAQVRAPEVFNPLFARHGVNAVLVPAEVAPQGLARFVKHVFDADNVGGLWLTIPHKSAVLPLLGHCDSLGRLAGAVNAVRRHADGSLEGALFDGIGFTKGLDRFGLPTRDRRVLMVGVGGAGVAIAASLAQRGCGELALFDAATGRAEQVAAQLNAADSNAGTCTRVTVAPSADPAGFDLVINATPLGLKATDALPFDVARLDRGAAVVDILMTRRPTPLLQACAARGIDAFAGFEMMLQQMPDYLAFFGMPELARAVQEDASEVRTLLHAA